MDFAKLTIQASELYNSVVLWCFDNQTTVDIIIPVVVIGSCAVYLKSRRKVRRRMHRYLWGTLMKRQDREKYQDMRIEDAITDVIFEMEYDGSMNSTEAQKKLRQYAEKLGLFGLLPNKDVKKSIRVRLKKRLGLKPADIPGGIKTVVVDKTYDPLKPDPEGLSASKYIKDKT